MTRYQRCATWESVRRPKSRKMYFRYFAGSAFCDETNDMQTVGFLMMRCICIDIWMNYTVSATEADRELTIYNKYD